MRFIVHVGPDTIGIIANNKTAIKKSLNKALPKRVPKRLDDVRYIFNGRRYTYSELTEACILTINEYFNTVKR